MERDGIRTVFKTMWGRGYDKRGKLTHKNPSDLQLCMFAIPHVCRVKIVLILFL